MHLNKSSSQHYKDCQKAANLFWTLFLTSPSTPRDERTSSTMFSIQVTIENSFVPTENVTCKDIISQLDKEVGTLGATKTSPKVS